ncbi:hypothetical protein [Roseospira visakhapatnamensis]|uniref:Uncharacterized protein n=1 Tax=Roseospira visakhapatnamensis TaxID=390880 RepID=A0A7W6RGP2_9PROT|nr:hypothetical protein [Roseospira visakhapatnamensis]MBB4267704.1 hypothetical protein [Roseospira visakhapatnamensis]
MANMNLTLRAMTARLADAEATANVVFPRPDPKVQREATVCPITGFAIPVDPLRYRRRATPLLDVLGRWEWCARALIGLAAMRALRRAGLVVVPRALLVACLREMDPETAALMAADDRDTAFSDQPEDQSESESGSCPCQTAESSQGECVVQRDATASAAASGDG